MNIIYLTACAIVIFVMQALSQNFTPSSNTIIQKETDKFLLPKVDKRIELLSIVFRLAGNMEYNDEIFKSYTSDIHAHFDKFKEHELIKFTREIRNKSWIGFDAVMAMAIYLDQPPTLNPLVPFSSSIPEGRWGQENALKSDFVRGFFWMKDLVNCLGEYEKNRDKYPTLESYMPAIIDFYKVEANKSDSMFDMKE